MKKRKTKLITSVISVLTLTVTAFAIEESEVQSAVAASGKSAVTGNVFIWFLCAIAFLKVSQEIDSILGSLGVNIGKSGGSMLSELFIAGRAIGAAVKAAGGSFGNIFRRGSSGGGETVGQALAAGGLAGAASQIVSNAAAAGATGRDDSLGGMLGGLAFDASLSSGGQFAIDTISTVATGDISTVGSITGEQAAEALTAYLGLNGESGQMSAIDAEAYGETAASVSAGLTFRDVEIGGGRITGYEKPSGKGERQFAMFNAAQYMQPNGYYEEVTTADGEKWYRQYEEPAVQKVPYENENGNLRFTKEIADQLPQVPRRKDRV